MQNDGDVKIVVGNNFDDIVLDESKDVLLEVSDSLAVSKHFILVQYNLIFGFRTDHAPFIFIPYIFTFGFGSDICSMVRSLPISRANLQQACQASKQCWVSGHCKDGWNHK